METINWRWLTGGAPPPDTQHDTITPGQHQVLDDMSDRCEALAATLNTHDPVDACAVIGSLAEVSTMLVVAAHGLQAEDPSIAAGLLTLGRACQHATRPFIHDAGHATQPDHPARAAARHVTADVLTVLHQLRSHPAP